MMCDQPPADVSRRLTWNLARQTSDRHAPRVLVADARGDVLCAECKAPWPCQARDAADDAMLATADRALVAAN